jgi:bifunctional DNA-binding transcriptional regulator/antitoxin component of YhaV-PrlF toxin-antitoxin module
MKFRGTVLLNGKTATGIAVPADVLDGLGAGKRPAVAVTLKRHAFRTTLGSVDGVPMIPVSAEVREAAGVAAGDTLEVEIELDTAPREVTVPEELAAALRKDPAAAKRFESLSYSRRKAYADSIAGAKTEETRTRRLEKTLAELRQG